MSKIDQIIDLIDHALDDDPAPKPQRPLAARVVRERTVFEKINRNGTIKAVRVA